MSNRDIVFSASGNSASLPSYSVYVWGREENGSLGLGQSSKPMELSLLPNFSSVASIDSSFQHTLVVKSDGTLWAWGNNGSGQLGNNTTVARSSPIQIGTLTNWARVAAVGPDTSSGIHYSLAVKTDGTLWAWGQNAYGQLGLGNTTNTMSPVQVGTLTDWARVDGGANTFQAFAVAVKTNGTLWTWGTNTNGQLGSGTTTSRSSPAQVGSVTTWRDVSCGEQFTIATRTDNTLWRWGFLVGGSTALSNPTQIGTLTNWSKVAAGYQHYLAVKTDGTLWSSGNNNSGQLGNNSTTSITSGSPVQIGTDTNWADVFASENTSYGIKTNGTLWVWGSGTNGAWGNGILGDTAPYYSSPVQVGTATNWLRVAAGYGTNSGGHALFAVTTGTNSLYVAGTNPLKLGLGISIGTGYSRSSPVLLGSYTDAKIGADHGIALKPDGTLWAWGSNQFGQLGTNDRKFYSSPVQVGTASDWAQIEVRDFNSFAIKQNGTLWSWGNNGDGMLGYTAASSVSSPVQVGTLSDWAQIRAGNRMILALKKNGTMWAWGYNQFGEVGDGTVITKSSPVQIGQSNGVTYTKITAGIQHCIAIGSNGFLYVWGRNDEGQLGMNDLVNRSTPTYIGNTNTYKEVAAGSVCSHGIRTNGTLWAWGYGLLGRLGLNNTTNYSTPTQVGTLSDWDLINSGNAFSFATRTNGTLWAWGSNTSGQLGDGTITDRSSPVQIGSLTTWDRAETLTSDGRNGTGLLK